MCFCVIGAGVCTLNLQECTAVCVCVWDVHLLYETAEYSAIGWQLNGTMISPTVTDSVNFTLQYSSIKKQLVAMQEDYLIIKAVPAQESMNAHSVASKSIADN